MAMHNIKPLTLDLVEWIDKKPPAMQISYKVWKHHARAWRSAKKPSMLNMWTTSKVWPTANELSWSLQVFGYSATTKQKAFIFDMMITILDDYFETLHTLNCFHTIQDQNVTIWNDHCQDSDASAARIGEAEVLALIRERTQISASLLKKLPNLKLIS